MACISESFLDHSPLVYRSGDKHVDISVLDVPYRPFQRGDGRLGRLWSGLPRLDIGVVRQAINYVDFSGLGIPGALDHIDVHLLVKVVDALPIKAEYLGRPIDDRGKRLHDPRVRKGLYNHFIAYPIAILTL